MRHVVALAFDPNPREALRPGSSPARLTTWEQRERLLRAAGADEVVRLAPEPPLLDLSPGEFVDLLIRRHGIGGIVEGPDFRFGRGRAGDVRALAELGAARGVAVRIVEPIEVGLSDHTMVRASSTMARWLVSHGRMLDAARVLGRRYAVPGIVARGDQRGRTIGYPTANIQTECLLPADGVYAGSARLPDGRVYRAAVSVGTKPMFDGRERTLEAHLLDAQRRPDGSNAIEGMGEYGWAIELKVGAWLRDQMKFESLGALLAQIGRDVDRVRVCEVELGGRACAAEVRS